MLREMRRCFSATQWRCVAEAGGSADALSHPALGDGKRMVARPVEDSSTVATANCY